jgi:hypothetical protein
MKVKLTQLFLLGSFGIGLISLFFNPMFFILGLFFFIKGLGFYGIYVKFLKDRFTLNSLYLLGFIFLFSHFSYFLYHILAVINFPLSRFFVLSVELVMPLVLIGLSFSSLKKIFASELSSLSYRELFFSVLIILFLSLLMKPFYGTEAMPRTDSLVEVGLGYDFYENILSGTDSSVWSDRFLHGYPTTFFEGFIMPYSGAVTSVIFDFVGGSTYQTIKHLVAFYFIMFALFFYGALRRIGLPSFLCFSAVATMFFMDLFSHGIGHGQFRHTYFMVFTVLAFIFLFDILQNISGRNVTGKKSGSCGSYVGLYLSFVIAFFIHPTMLIICGVLFSFFAISYLVFTKTIPQKQAILQLLGIGVLFIASVGFYLYGIHENNDYFSSTAFPQQISVKNTLHSVFSLGQSFSSIGFITPTTLIFSFIGILIAGLIVGIIRRSEQIVLLGSLSASVIFYFSLYYAKPLYFFVQYLDSFFFRVAHSIGFVFYLIGAVSIYILISYISEMMDEKEGSMVLIVLSIFVCFGIILFSVKVISDVTENVSETAHINAQFNPGFTFLSKQPYGRTIAYGIYPTTFEPAMSFRSGQPVVNYGNWLLQHMSIYKKIRTDQRLYNFDKGPYYLQNMIRSSGIKYVYMFLCPFPEETQQQLVGFSLDLGLNGIYQEGCIVIFKDNNTFAEMTDVVKDTGLSEELYYSYEGAYTVQPINKELSETDIIPKNGTVSSVKYIRPYDHEIVLNPSQKGYVHVKEQFFPWWHAYGDGQEIPVYKTKVGTMVVENSGYSEIVLRYEVPILVTALLIVTVLLVLISPVLICKPKAKKSLNKTKRSESIKMSDGDRN